MTLFFARGSKTDSLDSNDLRIALAETFDKLGQPNRVLAIPPDHTRFDSRGGELTTLAYELLGERLVDVLPALGTHKAMSPDELDMMFPGLPHSLVRVHHWREDVVTLGEVPREFVRTATEGIYDRAWPAQVNKLLVDGGHDLILSLGQVVPHEVIGMANYNKNIFVGTGGPEGINGSHYLSALYGMERIMGQCDTPLRRILNEGQDRYCKDMPLVYVLTVIESLPTGNVTRGLFIGDDHQVFWEAGKLASQVNCIRLDKPPKTMVVWMKPHKYQRTWLANKAIYRTRMAVADQGRLIVIAPGVSSFGEDGEIDRLIRKYGYRTTPEILGFVAENEELRRNLSAAAHLIHGSSEKRFEIVYCPGTLTKEEVTSIGYSYADNQQMIQRYRVDDLNDGWHETSDGEEFYFIRDPGLGLWMHAGHPAANLSR